VGPTTPFARKYSRKERIVTAVINSEGLVEKPTQLRAVQMLKGAHAVADEYERVNGFRSVQIDNVITALSKTHLLHRQTWPAAACRCRGEALGLRRFFYPFRR
jgi:hypothetical protein